MTNKVILEIEYEGSSPVVSWIFNKLKEIEEVTSIREVEEKGK